MSIITIVISLDRGLTGPRPLRIRLNTVLPVKFWMIGISLWAARANGDGVIVALGRGPSVARACSREYSGSFERRAAARPRSNTSGGGARAAVEITGPFRTADADARQRLVALNACGAVEGENYDPRGGAAEAHRSMKAAVLECRRKPEKLWSSPCWPGGTTGSIPAMHPPSQGPNGKPCSACG